MSKDALTAGMPMFCMQFGGLIAGDEQHIKNKLWSPQALGTRIGLRVSCLGYLIMLAGAFRAWSQSSTCPNPCSKDPFALKLGGGALNPKSRPKPTLFRV